MNMDSKPLYDDECISEEDKILIQLEVMMIDNLLARVVAYEEKIIDFNAELKYIASWLEIQRTMKMMTVFSIENISCLQVLLI